MSQYLSQLPYGWPKPGARIVVAMSGGVDSSVAAAWLKKMNYDVIGISLQLHDMAENTENQFGSCCSLSDLSDARRVAEKIDIPFYVNNMESEFNESVIDNFVEEYLNGRTPNPCVKCNEKVKFNHLMNWAMDLGADFLATGHYATLRFNPKNELFSLCKGQDASKDQSYFLFTLKQEDLKRTVFPVGGLDKKQVRELAEQLNLGRVAHKPDSQEICFVQGKSYKEFIQERAPASLLKKGILQHVDGRVVGEHEGLHHYTLGQRKGIGLNLAGEPLYVLELDSQNNRVIVGPESYLYKTECVVSEINWILPPELDKAQEWKAKIRYRAKECSVEVYPVFDGRVRVVFKEPQRAITPGQALVLYRDDEVVGGGWIEAIP